MIDWKDDKGVWVEKLDATGDRKDKEVDRKKDVRFEIEVWRNDIDKDGKPHGVYLTTLYSSFKGLDLVIKLVGIGYYGVKNDIQIVVTDLVDGTPCKPSGKPTTHRNFYPLELDVRSGDVRV